MIGSVSAFIPASSITSVPGGITTSKFFGYSTSAGYASAETIEPGKGYWVKANQPGRIILSSGNVTESSSLSARIKIVATSENPPLRAPELGIEPPASRIHREFSVSQNYPNPFNPLTVIEYQLPVDSKVTIRIYNMLGEEVRSLVEDEFQEAGIRSIAFNASALSSGLYFYKIQAGQFVKVKKMLLIR
jgi:hypothetical protein